MPRRSRITCVCQNPRCAKYFTVKPSEKENKGSGVYCSLNCRSWRTPEERFWLYVDKSAGSDACWLWTSTKGEKGHGHFRIDGKQIGAHCFSWILAYGPIPQGLCVLHNCPGRDNASCVQPEHLFLGTRADNMYDRHRKGGYPVVGSGEWSAHIKACNAQRIEEGRDHQPRGEQHYNVRLTDQDILAIRSLAGTMSQRKIGVLFGVGQTHIGRILRDKVRLPLRTGEI